MRPRSLLARKTKSPQHVSPLVDRLMGASGALSASPSRTTFAVPSESAAFRVGPDAIAVLVRDGQDGADGIGRIAIAQLRGEPVVAKTTLERGELVRMNTENRVRVHTRSHGTVCWLAD